MVRISHSQKQLVSSVFRKSIYLFVEHPLSSIECFFIMDSLILIHVIFYYLQMIDDPNTTGVAEDEHLGDFISVPQVPATFQFDADQCNTDATRGFDF